MPYTVVMEPSERPCLVLVEDSKADQMLFSQASKRAGLECDIEIHAKGDDALRRLHEQGPPSLVVLDLNLPGLTGLEVLQEIRSAPALSTTVVLILTTSDQPEDAAAAYRTGANSFITKPSDFDGFVAVLTSIKSYWLQTATLPPKVVQPLSD